MLYMKTLKSNIRTKQQTVILSAAKIKKKNIYIYIYKITLRKLIYANYQNVFCTKTATELNFLIIVIHQIYTYKIIQFLNWMIKIYIKKNYLHLFFIYIYL